MLAFLKFLNEFYQGGVSHPIRDFYP